MVSSFQHYLQVSLNIHRKVMLAQQMLMSNIIFSEIAAVSEVPACTGENGSLSRLREGNTVIV